MAIVPDYYRGDGPASPDDYDDFATLMAHIGALDFGRAVHDVLDGLDYLQVAGRSSTRTRIASWGYCTGGTMALFAACLARRPRSIGRVLPEPADVRRAHTTKPVHAADLLWNISCPILFLIGDQDVVLPPAALEAFRERLDTWGVDARIEVYEGAPHAFNAHGSSMYHQAADEQSWDDATAFLAQVLHPTPPSG